MLKYRIIDYQGVEHDYVPYADTDFNELAGILNQTQIGIRRYYQLPQEGMVPDVHDPNLIWLPYQVENAGHHVLEFMVTALKYWEDGAIGWQRIVPVYDQIVTKQWCNIGEYRQLHDALRCYERNQEYEQKIKIDISNPRPSFELVVDRESFGKIFKESVLNFSDDEIDELYQNTFKRN